MTHSANPGRQDSGQTLRHHLIRGVLGTGGLGVLSRGLSLLIAILLARALGAEGYGYYAFATAAVGFIAIPTQLGLPQLLTREVATYHARSEWPLMRGIRRRATQLAVIAVIISITIGGGGLLFLADRIAAFEPTTFAVALMLLPLLVATAVSNSLMLGLRQVMHATWPGTLQPLVFLLVLLVLIAGIQPLGPTSAVAANLGATAFASFAAALLLRRHWPPEAAGSQPTYQTRNWMKSLLPFTMLAGINVVTQNTDVLMLGAMTTAEDVGVYNVVAQGGMLVSFSLAAFNTVLSPNIARLHAQGAHDKMQRLLTLSTAGMTLVAALTALVLIVAGEWLLQQIFGGAFVRGYSALCILALAQLFNAAMGSVGLFLSMTGYEQETLRAISLSAVCNVILNALLIPEFGLAGAASATAISVVLWNVILGVQLYRRLALVPGPFVFRSKSRKGPTKAS